MFRVIANVSVRSPFTSRFEGAAVMFRLVETNYRASSGRVLIHKTNSAKVFCLEDSLYRVPRA